jgi:hypothetical protein
MNEESTVRLIEGSNLAKLMVEAGPQSSKKE